MRPILHTYKFIIFIHALHLTLPYSLDSLVIARRAGTKSGRGLRRGRRVLQYKASRGGPQPGVAVAGVPRTPQGTGKGHCERQKEGKSQGRS